MHLLNSPALVALPAFEEVVERVEGSLSLFVRRSDNGEQQALPQVRQPN
jgi:hypothetical protein